MKDIIPKELRSHPGFRFYPELFRAVMAEIKGGGSRFNRKDGGNFNRKKGELS